MSNKKLKTKSNTKKTFQIEYLQILEETEISEKKIKRTPYDITNLLNDIKNLKETERSIDYYGDSVRLESVKK